MNGMQPYGALRASTALLLCCAMLLLGAAAGYSLGGRERVKIDQPQEAAQNPAVEPLSQPAQSGDTAQVSQTMGEETVSPEAVVTWRYEMACGHTVEVVDNQAVVDKTRAELEALYGPAAVESFSPQAVTMRLAREQYCPQHYVLVLQEGVLTVRKTDESLQEQVLLTLDVDLPEDAAAECVEGLPFDSLEDINVYLEGIEG